jgi:hypothetical protein
MQSAPEGRTHIYEVVNHLRKESLIALCPDAPRDFRRRLGPPLPPPIGHWAANEDYIIDQIAAAMTVADAKEFLTMFLASVKSKDWKTMAWQPEG